ncbi:MULTISPECIES: asparagine synthase-related protein [Actinomyces]|uniref:asparagine synthase (glutamine-hydrolyzing) n=1 Tax=Actinomyces respiraculi TaxID=2744574 RepID=A0A7T0LL79_9ACTO|nr:MULTISPECIES: asparagine synthase-related protein [Actinomyces]QPL05809.1 7-cyano-7-deazaguanine synthase [Actinomyces respiraculi]
MDIDLSLASPAWTAVADGLRVRADHPCTAPTSPDVLRDHPGRLAAVEVTEEHVLLAVDRLRSWPLFWAARDGGRRLLVTDDPAALRSGLECPALLAPAVAEMEDAGFVTGARTLLRGVHQVPQGAVVTISRRTGAVTRDDYAFAAFNPDEITDPEDFAVAFLDALGTTMTRLLDRLGGRRLLLPLSGGLDSRLLLAWLLRHGEAGRVATFTYGVPGAREVEVSRRVAQQAGVPWCAVPYERRALLEHWHSPATAAFLSASHCWSALPHVQDWYALSVMRARGEAGEGDVVLPGHTVVGNMHDKQLLDAVPVSRATAARAIIHHHHDLQGRPERAGADPWVAVAVREAMTLAGFDGSGRTLRSLLEGYNLRERQTKYINNSVRAYEHLGMDWALPMLDAEVWHTWQRGTAAATATRDLYRVIVDRLWARATGASEPESAYYEVTRVDPRTRAGLKGVLAATHLLPAAERVFSTWSSLHSETAFDALFTDTSRARAAVGLLSGRKTLGLWTRAFLRDTWCRSAVLFRDLPVVEE